MKICIIGFGYVGAVTAACFAEAGHSVTGVDVSHVKVDELNSGVSPLSEFGLQDLVAKHVQQGSLRATTQLAETFHDSELFIISVGTPTGAAGDVNLGFVESVVEELGALLADSQDFKVIVLTSTVPPGTLKNIVRPTLERLSGKKAGVDFGLCFSPEFLREGTAIADFSRPEKVVLGCSDDRSRALLHSVFAPFDGPIIDTTPEIAEMVKFSANAWHALKVAFANEIGRICQAAEIDSHEVMSIFKQDKRLNISETYLTPGFAFGGSCLPKDLRTLTYRARAEGVLVPVLDSILPSNQAQLAEAISLVEKQATGRILMLGVAFKSGTDDLRESPTIPLAEALLGKGRELRIFDEYVQISRLVGANLAYVKGNLPHLAGLLGTDPQAEIEAADTVVLSQWNPRFAALIGSLSEDKLVIDLTGVGRGSATKATYLGLSW